MFFLYLSVCLSPSSSLLSSLSLSSSLSFSVSVSVTVIHFLYLLSPMASLSSFVIVLTIFLSISTYFIYRTSLPPSSSHSHSRSLCHTLCISILSTSVIDSSQYPNLMFIPPSLSLIRFFFFCSPP